MIRAFPESGAVIVEVRAAVGAATPIPFAVRGDNRMLDIIPLCKGALKVGLVTGQLPAVQITHDRFSLHPPVAVFLTIARLRVIFVDHAVGGKTFGRCGGQVAAGTEALHVQKPVGEVAALAQDFRGLDYEPGCFDVMSEGTKE